MTRTTTLGAQFAPTYHRPFLRYFEGENGGAPGGTPPAAPAAPAAPPAAPAPPAPAPAAPTPPPAASPAAQPPAATPPINYRGDPDEYVRELRAENKTAREAREAAEKERDAATQEREAAAAERDTLKREKAVLLAAPRLGASADLLLDSGSFTQTLASIDLADQAAVDKAITDALERNSAFRTGPALPPSSGGGHQGGSPNQPTPTLEGAVKAALTPKV
jgi:hypothetical protein